MQKLFRRMAPALVGAGVTQLNVSIDIIIGTLLPAGSVSILYYADRVNQLPLGVIGTAAGTALLPAITRHIALGEDGAAMATLNRALESVLMLTLPAAIGLAVAARPVMDVLFVRGAFTLHTAVLAGHSLAAFAIGLPVFALVKMLTPGFFARGDTVTPLKIGIAAVALNLALNLRLHASAEGGRPGAGDQPVLGLQRRLAGLPAAPARAFRAGCAGPPPRAAHPAGRRRHGRGALWRRACCCPPGKTTIPRVSAPRPWSAASPMLGVAASCCGAFDLAELARHAAPPPAQAARPVDRRRQTGAKPDRPWHVSSPAFSPPASPTLGNYLGALRNWVRCRTAMSASICVVDLHAITSWQDPAQLREQTPRDGGDAAGLRHRSRTRSILFHQSAVPAHARLAWIFNCVARIGWLNRMTQFKDKAGKDREAASTGLYVYPNLMAADIHAYHATRVPVGDDQRQHLELANDIAREIQP